MIVNIKDEYRLGKGVEIKTKDGGVYSGIVKDLPNPCKVYGYIIGNTVKVGLENGIIFHQPVDDIGELNILE